MRKTKIVCTLGPATDDVNVLRELIKAGMNVARLNFSHGTHAEHRERADKIKALRREMNVPIALMIDTKGPDVRVERFENNFVELRSGDIFTLHSKPVMGNEKRASVTFADFCSKLSPGDAVMLDDGLIELTVESADACEARCRVVNGGIVANNKSVNVPGVKLDIPYMREKDVEDINFAIDNDFDYVAASFVRSAEDVMQIQRILDSRGAGDIKIISKIENSEGIDNIDEILEISDSIMIARGDMGVELPLAQLPSIQKLLIKKAQLAGKKTITATQMLESMIKNPRPTRAETSDVANAIYDGTSAVMLSAETSVGKYPVETVRTMARIAEVTEADIDYEKRFYQLEWRARADSVADAISHSVNSAAYRLNAAKIITLTLGGGTAYLVSRYRPASGLVAFTPSEKVYQQLSLSWGCTPLLFEEMNSPAGLYDQACRRAISLGLINEGDMVVFAGGDKFGKIGGTNLLRAGIATALLPE